jgi:sortase B
VSVGPGQNDPFKYHIVSDFNDKADFDEYMENVRERQLFDTGSTATYVDKLLSLSTCEYSQRDGRFVVVAKRISKRETEA